MNQYLNKDEVLAAFEWGGTDVVEDFGDECVHGFSWGNIKSTIDSIPAADVVPVVRCKYCRHFHLNMENDPYCDHRNGLSDPSPDDFCSYGQRKEGQNV